MEVYIDLQYLNDSNLDIKIDMALAKSYKLEIDRMMKELNIKDEVKLHHMLMFPEIIKKKKKRNAKKMLFGNV